MPKKPDSPAMQLLRVMWKHGYATSKPRLSWTLLNGAMEGALQLAIISQLRFDPDDLTLVNKNAADDGFGVDLTERIYSLAVNGVSRCGLNRSAAVAFETWANRQPFLIRLSPGNRGLGRIAVGTRFVWYGTRVQCTSFAADGKHLTARNWESTATRARVTHQGIREYHLVIKRKAAAQKRLECLRPQQQQAFNAWAKSRFKGTSSAWRVRDLDLAEAELDRIEGSAHANRTVN